jgi:hypothetical protein
MLNTIAFSREIIEYTNRNNVQAFSLTLIDRNILEPYATGSKKALILYESRVYQKKIRILGSQEVAVYDNSLNTFLKKGKRVLLVLPAPDSRRFVLQSRITEIYIDRFLLQVLDPRIDHRYKIKRHSEASFKIIPPSLLVRLQQNAATIARNIVGLDNLHAESAIESTAEQQYAITETVSCAEDAESDAATAEFAELLRVHSFETRLLDIYLGGLAMEAPKKIGESIRNEIAYIDCRFPVVPNVEAVSPYNAALDLKLFGVVREFRATDSLKTIHVMFVARLPDTAAGFFA